MQPHKLYRRVLSGGFGGKSCNFGFIMMLGKENHKHKHSVAIIDGNPHHRQELSAALTPIYLITTPENSEKSFEELKIAQPSAIFIGETAGNMSGLRYIRALRRIPHLSKTPVIFVADRPDPEKTTAATLIGANDILVKPYHKSALFSTLSAQINTRVERGWNSLPPLASKALRNTIDVFNGISAIIENNIQVSFGVIKDKCAPLVEAINNNDFKRVLEGVKNHDNYSYAHSVRVATFLSMFGKVAGLSTGDQLTLASAGLLHDTGKMMIPHEILNKPGRLTDQEFIIMKTHVPETVAHLRACPDIPRSVIAVAQQHHEKLNGQGYPLGLKGGQLNSLARMAAIVDVFSALTDRRPYKPPIAAEEALAIMANDMPGHLDLHFLGMFREMLLDATR